MKIILVRHGETDANLQRRVQGASDSPLNATGHAQAQALGRRLRECQIDAVYSSPQTRALETARLIAEAHSLEVAILNGLQELDLGDMDGLTGPQLHERYPDFMRQWARDVRGLRMPGGESIAELQQRAWASIREMEQRHPEGAVVAVSHNFAIQSILCRSLGLDLQNFRRVRQDLAAMSILEMKNGEPILITMNDGCHLRGVPST